MNAALANAVADTLARYDLLTHPFYTAWSRGELSREQLHFYGEQYLAHVAAFPTYLTALHARMPEGAARRAVLNNAFEEEADGRSHADLWRDFVRGMEAPTHSKQECHFDRSGSAPAESRSGETCGCSSPDKTLPEITALVATFRDLAQTATPVAAIAAFHAYESQVPRIAAEKRRGLREQYGADAATCEYFRVHETADVHHAQVWTDLLEAELTAAGARSEESAAACEAEILRGTEVAARALWNALDGIEAARTQIQ
jgi:pyrroloquinoline-quinone synthase